MILKCCSLMTWSTLIVWSSCHFLKDLRVICRHLFWWNWIGFFALQTSCSTVVSPLSKPTSDHVPYVAQIGSGILKANIFHLESFWVEFASFMPTVIKLWQSAPYFLQPAKDLNAKLKKVRQGLRIWSKFLSNLSKLIENCSWTLALWMVLRTSVHS